MQLICEVIPRRDASTDELQALGRALVEWKQRILPQKGLRGDLVSVALDDLLSGELPTPAGILIANAARSVLRQANVDAAIRAYLTQLVERNWEAVRLDRRALERRAICGVITLTESAEGEQQDVAAMERLPSPEEIREAVDSLVTVLPRAAVHSVELKRLVADSKQTLRQRAAEWRDDAEPNPGDIEPGRGG